MTHRSLLSLALLLLVLGTLACHRGGVTSPLNVTLALDREVTVAAGMADIRVEARQLRPIVAAIHVACDDDEASFLLERNEVSEEVCGMRVELLNFSFDGEEATTASLQLTWGEPAEPEPEESGSGS